MKKEKLIRSPLFYTGDKYKLIPELKQFFPKEINNFYEPFVGGGSVLLNVDAKNYFENGNGIIVEVTMAEGRTQTMMEVWPIQRHLLNFIEENNIPAQCIFAAPTIFSDSKDQIEWVKDRKQLVIRDYPIEKFTEYLETEKTLYLNG